MTAEAVKRESLSHLAAACGGDVRKAVNAVELLFFRRKARGGQGEL